jgi:hypothetical protein
VTSNRSDNSATAQLFCTIVKRREKLKIEVKNEGSEEKKPEERQLRPFILASGF